MKSSPKERAASIAVRTAHIAAAGLVLGAVHFGQDPGMWPAFAGLTGLALVADELRRHGLAWLRWAQCLALTLKLGALALPALLPSTDEAVLWIALVAGSAISHAPGAVRHFALWGEPGPCAPGSCDSRRSLPSSR